LVRAGFAAAAAGEVAEVFFAFLREEAGLVVGVALRLALAEVVARPGMLFGGVVWLLGEEDV